MSLTLKLGVKTDPIEYRFSYEWLFRLLAEEQVTHVQLGSFFELYQLPDSFFVELRRQAEDYGLRITSLFTAHRELGGFFRNETGFESVAHKNYERLIEVASLLDAKAAGSNPGAILRDQMGLKANGIACYLSHMKQLMEYAKQHGLEWLTIEPMSCLAEPPTLPDEIHSMAEELYEFHNQNPETTVAMGYCVDVSHGYADRCNHVKWNPLELLRSALTHTCELHLKNTDVQFHSTFGFSPEDRTRGIVDVSEIKRLLRNHADVLPVEELTGYLEISGPKLGRDYSDHHLEADLRASLHYLRETFVTQDANDEGREISPSQHIEILPRAQSESSRIRIAPSMMCADICRLEQHLRSIESVGVDCLHLDVMDAHFVPNMPLGLDLMKRLRSKTDLPFDIHLMVDNNEFFIDQAADIGAQMVSLHVESAIHLDRLLDQIRRKGMQAGVALNPATPLSAIDYVLDRLDFVLIMTVNPGFAGQTLVPSAFRKISDCRALLDANGRDIPIEVDGNVSFDNIPQMVACGGDILVAGTSSLFSKQDTLANNAKRMRQAAEEGLLARRKAEVLA